MVSDTFLNNPYYSPILLLKTILAFGLFRIFANKHKILKDNGKKKEIIGGKVPV